MIRSNLFLLLAAATLCAAVHSSAVRADTASLGSSNDTWIRDGFSYTVNGIDAVLDARLTFVPYVQFDMSGLNIDTISAATLRLWKVPSARNDTITNDRYATYGLADDPNNTLQFWDESADFDPNDGFNGLDFRNTGAEWGPALTNGVDRTKLVSLDPQDGGVTITELVNNTTGEITVSGADLVAFLNSRADASGLVTFLMPVEASTQGWGIASKENATESLRPILDLEYTVVPEPATCVLLVAAAMASMMVRRREV